MRPQLTKEQRIAAGLGLTEEAYQARKEEQEQRRAPLTTAERIIALRELQRGAAEREREALEAQIKQLEEEERAS